MPLSFRPHLRQFLRYLISGGAAVVCDFGSYFLMLRLDVWYVTANVTSNVIGFFCAFLFHKYFVFEKREEILRHFVRYCILNVVTIVAQTLMLYAFVEFLLIDEGSGKFLSWAITVLANFFLYKFFVYV